MYDAPDILPLILSWFACLPRSQLDRQRKLSIYYLKRNSNFLLLRNYLTLIYSFDPQSITSPVHRILSWCPMCQLLQTSDSANFLLEIQITFTFMSYTLTFELYTQNLELWGIESATKFCNWICLSSWDYRYSHLIWYYRNTLCHIPPKKRTFYHFSVGGTWQRPTVWTINIYRDRLIFYRVLF